MKTLPNQPSALLCLPLRQELLQTVRELHEIMRVSTLRIRESLPLNSAVDNASHYLACCESIPEVIDQQHVTLQTLRVNSLFHLDLPVLSYLCSFFRHP